MLDEIEIFTYFTHIKINKVTGSKYKFYYHYYNCHSNTLILIFSREIKFYKADNDSR